MLYQITGKHIDVGDALRTHVADGLGAIVDKYAYAGRPTDGQVVFSRDAHEFCCEATVHLTNGADGSGEGEGDRDLRGLRELRGQDGEAATPLQATVKEP